MVLDILLGLLGIIVILGIISAAIKGVIAFATGFPALFIILAVSAIYLIFIGRKYLISKGKQLLSSLHDPKADTGRTSHFNAYRSHDTTNLSRVASSGKSPTRFHTQLSIISNTDRIWKKPMFNDDEAEVFHAIRRSLKDAGRYNLFVHGQVSLGEILGTASEDAFSAINAKRVDFLLADSFGHPKLVVEQRGGGSIISDDDAIRNEVKREAIRKAGILYTDFYGSKDAEEKVGMLLAQI